MGLHIIIDGYNLIRQSKTLSRVDSQDLTRGREALIERLAAYRRFKSHRMTVVFDGVHAPQFAPLRDHIKGIRIVFSRGGELADSVIVRMAQQEREQAMVVTSDQAVARSATACGAAAIDSLEFESRLAMAIALHGEEGAAEEIPDRRVSTRKKGEGRRLSKRLRQQRMRASKL
jgi:uncharacterized protein